MSNSSSENQVEKCIRMRCSVRNFSDKKIDREILLRLVKSGIYAPSGSNWQNQRFLIIDNASEITRIGSDRFVWPYKGNMEVMKKLHPSGIIGHATGLIIVFADSYSNDRRGNGEYHIWETLEIQNCAASIENILLAATSLGLGTCWISASDKMNYTRMFSGKSWRHLLADYEIPPWYKLQGMIMIGYPKSVDAEGYPKGEKMHGATLWQSTERRPIEHYLVPIRKNTGINRYDIKITLINKIKISLLSKLIEIAHRVSKTMDLKIHNIEMTEMLDYKPEKR